MSERKMSLQTFIRKCEPSTGKLTAEEFLFKHQDYIVGYPFLLPIIEAYQLEQITGTQTRQAIAEALHSYFLEDQARKLEGAVAKAKLETAKQKIKRGETTRIESPDVVLTGGYSIYVMVKNIARDGKETIEVGVDERFQEMEEEDTGKIIRVKVLTPMIFQAEMFQQATRKAALRVFATGNSTHARIINNSGKPIETVLTRNEAIEMLFKRKKGAICRQPAKSTKSLKMGGKAKQTRVVFSGSS